jgi:hypothetical protein
MLVVSQGGTRKSVLIEAITESFAYHRQERALSKCAPSGIAAIHIGGCTLHFWVGIGVHRPKLLTTGNKLQERRKQNILGKICLIIDEMSIIHDTLLVDVAKIVAHMKKIGGDSHGSWLKTSFTGIMQTLLMYQTHILAGLQIPVTEVIQ